MQLPSALFLKDKMINKTFYAALLLLSAVHVSSAIAGQIVDPKDGPVLVVSVEHVFSEEYKEAEEIISEYIKKHPERPDGYFFMAAMYAEHMTASNDNSLYKPFNKYAKLCIQKARNLIKINEEDAAGYFYLGGIAGYKGLIKARDQKLVSAFRSAIVSKKNLEMAIKLDPELYDSYFGLGTLYYFSSKKHKEEGGLVGWIVKKFITKNRDMREEAIEMLEKAIEKGRMTSTYAYSSLMWVMISEEKYDKAYQMAEEMLELFPKYKHGYWVRARVEMIKGDCEGAAENFYKILELVNDQKLPVDRYKDVQTGILLTQICTNIGGWEWPKIVETIKNIRKNLKNPKSMALEYQNAKRVVKDWGEMLTEIERKGQRIERLSRIPDKR